MIQSWTNGVARRAKASIESTLLVVVGCLVFCGASSARETIVTPLVAGNGFEDFADIRAREELAGIRQVNLEEAPELKAVYQKLIALTEKLLIDQDEKRPIRLILADDMTPGAAFLPTKKGSRALVVNVGLLRFLKNDDELAFVLGHELEHGLSVLEEKVSREISDAVFRHDAGSMLENKLLKRVVENEVDLKSVFRRVRAKGYNPYAVPVLFGRFIDTLGDHLSETHTLLSTRLNAVELELTGMTRVAGERIPTVRSHDIVNPDLQQFLSSGEFAARRLARVIEIQKSYGGPAREIVADIKRLDKIPVGQVDRTKQQIQKKVDSLQETFARNHAEIDAALTGLVTEEELLDLQLQHQAAFEQALQDARAQVLGRSATRFSKIEAMDLLDGLSSARYRSLLTPDEDYSPLAQNLHSMFDAEKTFAKLDHDLPQLVGQALEEARSAIVAVKRQLMAYYAQKRILLSGYRDAGRAVALAQRGRAWARGDDYVKRQQVNEIHRSLEYEQKHIGPLMDAADRYLAGLRMDHAPLIVSQTMGPSLKRAVETLGSMPKQQQPELHRFMLEAHLRNFESRLVAAKTAQETNTALREGLEIFREDHLVKLRNAGLSGGTELAHLETERLARFLIRFIEIYIDHSRNELQLARVRVELANVGSGLPFELSSQGFWVDPSFAKKMDLPKIILAKVAKDLGRKVSELKAAGPSQSLWEVFRRLDESLQEAGKLIGSGALSHNPLLSPVVLGHVGQIRDHIGQSIPASLLVKFPTMPEVLQLLFSMRYPELTPGVSARFDPVSAKRSLQTLGPVLKQLGKDREALEFIDGALDFDSFDALLLAAGEPDVSVVLEHPELFEHSRDRVPRTLGEVKQNLKRRIELLEAVWSRGARGKTLKGIMAIARQHRNFDLLPNNGRQEALRIVLELPRKYADLRARELIRQPVVAHANSKTKFQNMFTQMWEESLYFEFDELLRFQKDLNLSEKDKVLFFAGYIEALRYSERNEARPKLGASLRSHVGHLLSSAFQLEHDLQPVAHLPLNEKIQLFLMNSEARDPEPFTDMFFDHIWKQTENNLPLRASLLDESIVGRLFYDDSKRKLALWQLDQKHQIGAIETALKQRSATAPGVRQERAFVRPLQQTLNRQFPDNSYVKDTVLNRVEDMVRTSQAEGKILKTSRVNLDNWAEIPELVLADLPSMISQKMKSSFDRLQIVEYLIGIRAEYPKFVDALDPIYGQRDRVRATLKDFRQRFVAADPMVRTLMLQPMLDQKTGILAEPQLVTSLHRDILGKNYDEPVVRALFETYLEMVPEAERRVILSHILGSFADARVGFREASLKTVLEAMGPFGVKAGQFLYTSGLLPPEQTKDLASFLDNVLPPDRPRVVKDFEARFGKAMNGIVSIEDRPGSGSINYVQGIKARGRDGTLEEGVVRVRRPHVEGIVGNENEIWRKVVVKLRSSASPRERASAEVVEETRLQAFETLRPGGPELDHSIERATRQAVAESYERRVYQGYASGFTISVAEPWDEIQALVDPEHSKTTTVYRRLNATPLDAIHDTKLRAAIAEEIVISELKALFDKGRYDPDGHPGNWLVDLAQKRIVRIDTAQFRQISNEDRLAFRKVFAQLNEPMPNFATPKHAQALATLLEADSVPSDRLTQAVAKAAAQLNWHEFKDPAERLFALRQAVMDQLGGKPVKIKDALRSGLASIGKVSGFRKYIGSGFNHLFAEYSGASAFAVSYVTWRRSVKNWIVARKRQFWRKKPDQQPRPPISRESPEELRVIAEHEIEKLEASLTSAAQTAQPGTTTGQNRPSGDTYHRVTMSDWKPIDRGEVRRISTRTFDSLPDGTELYNGFDPDRPPVIKGVDSFREFDPEGMTEFGIRAAEFLDHGGPRVNHLILGPPDDLNLKDNPYYTNSMGTRVVLLTEQQYSKLPDGTVLIDLTGKRLIKGKGRLLNDLGTKLGHLAVGFPDASQRGFESIGVDIKRGCAARVVESVVGQLPKS